MSFNAEALTISTNTVSHCGDGGILVYRWEAGEDGTQIVSNRVSQISAKSDGTGQNGNGINVFRGSDITIANNKISDCAFSAIRANAASNVQILGNSCLRSGEVAVFVEFGFQGAVVSNNLIETAASGISITNFNDGGRLAVCANNLLRDITGPGPYEEPLAELGVGIAAEADTIVTSNTVESASRYGLVLGWGPYMRNLIASQNLVRHAPVGIAASVAKGAKSALISQNILDGCPTNIAGFAWDEQVTEDLAMAPADQPEHLQVTGNLVSGG